MIRVKIRLYKIHDYDLLSLYRSLGPGAFAATVREVLRCYVEGIQFNPKGLLITVMPETGEKSSPVTCHLSIDERLKKETALIKSVEETRRPAFIKALLRAYLFNVLAQAYLAGGNIYDAPLPVSEREENSTSKKPPGQKPLSRRRNESLGPLEPEDIHNRQKAVEVPIEKIAQSLSLKHTDKLKKMEPDRKTKDSPVKTERKADDLEGMKELAEISIGL